MNVCLTQIDGKTNALLAMNMLVTANLNEYSFPFKMRQDRESVRINFEFVASNFRYLTGPIPFLGFYSSPWAGLPLVNGPIFFLPANASDACAPLGWFWRVHAHVYLKGSVYLRGDVNGCSINGKYANYGELST